MSEDKTVVKPDVSEYQTARAASGAKTLNNGDTIATNLVGVTLEELYDLAAEALETDVKTLQNGDGEKFKGYGHLNQGMQRMNLGNRLRGVYNAMEKEKEGSGDRWAKSFFSGVRQAAAARVKEMEAERKEREKERAAKAKEKAKAKPKSKAKAA